MKIIATTGGRGYLVEMTADEIAATAGFGSIYNSEWEKVNGGRRDPQVGLEVKVEAIRSWHARVLQNQDTAKSAANTLRALADLIGGALPDFVIPPHDPDFDEVKEGGAA